MKSIKEVFEKFEKKIDIDEISDKNLKIINQLKSEIQEIHEKELREFHKPIKEIDNLVKEVKPDIDRIVNENQQLKKEIERLNNSLQATDSLYKSLQKKHDKLEKDAYTLEENVLIVRKENNQLKQREKLLDSDMATMTTPKGTTWYHENTVKKYFIERKKIEDRIKELKGLIRRGIIHFDDSIYYEKLIKELKNLLESEKFDRAMGLNPIKLFR